MTAASTVRGMRYDTPPTHVTTPPTIATAAAALRRGACTADDLLDASLAAIERDGARTNAFILVDAEGARAAARAMDDERRRGVDRGPLHGMPLSIKDLIDMRGLPTTAASRAMPAAPASDDAPLVATLREAGAVLIGKTNLHEFALGTTSDESAFGPVRHPADADRSAGGSSGGSAAAVAIGMGLGSIGTDTGGSIRIPAAACGVVGLKPTYGEITLAGVVPLSTSLDHAGPIARTVEDAALIWSALTGTAVPEAAAPRGLRLGLLGGSFAAPMAAPVRLAFDAALDALRDAGILVEEVLIDEAGSLGETYVDIALPEAAAWHAAHVHAPDEAYTPGVLGRLARGREVPAVRYLAGQAARERLRRAIDGLLARADALVTPPLGVEQVELEPGAPALPVRAAMLKHTQPFNLSGHPAISIPVPAGGLPVGLQLAGPRHGTARLLAVAAACERVLGMR